MNFPDWSKETWTDCHENPVIGFYRDHECGFAIGDPQILTPGQFDSKWHAFYHGFYEDFTPFYHRLDSSDGIRWTLNNKWPWKVGPTCLFHEGDTWYLYLTCYTTETERKEYGPISTYIAMRSSRDLINWSDPEPILFPELSWEREYMPVCYTAIQVRNPCVVKLPNGIFRMYYSGGTVMLPHCNYEEPKHISFADALTPCGPFIKHGEPVLSPDERLSHRNFGAGALKVFGYGEDYLGLYNSIYLDGDGYPHSAINLIMSKDGTHWEEAPYNPIIPPAPGGEDFKKQFVYQLDLVRAPDGLRIYYNGRDKWSDGIERIGMSSRPDDPSIYKLWDL